MTQADYERRVRETRALLEAEGLDGFLIASQYNRRYLTGFTPTDGDITESSGMALVTQKSLRLITSTFFLSGLEHEVEPSGAQIERTDGQPESKALGSILEQDGVRKLGFEKEWFSYARWDQLRNALGDAVEWKPSDDLVMRVRARKDDTEIATMRRAAEIADAAFAQLITELHPGMTERQIAHRLDSLMRQMGAEEPSFPTIIASGPNGALPHAVPSERETRVGEPLLMDFGARYNGYCSDMTRTVCLGEPDPRLVEIYGVVYAGQDAALHALRGGARRGREMDGAARKIIGDAGYAKEFMHSLGHGVGLAVHELPYAASLLSEHTEEDDKALAQVERLDPGVVITNEPGIYIPEWGGVRLEDMILIGEDDVTVITGRNPKQILQIAVA